MSEPGRGAALLVDFDGTITLQDVAVVMLERYSTADWTAIEARFIAGETDILENMRAQFAHVLQPPEVLLAHARRVVGLRAGWPELVRCAADRGIALAVVSGGLRFYVEALLPETTPRPAVHCLDAAYGAAGWRILLPEGGPRTAEVTGFKEGVIEGYRERHSAVWFVGNGYSDRGAAGAADRVWAIEPLLSYCREHGIAARPFATFDDVREEIERLTPMTDCRDREER